MTVQHPKELGAFIKVHRERLKPEDAGLPPGIRRRAKGLRREEVAQQCGISPTWLTWIEQGRTTSVSSVTLKKISQALLLSKAEQEYLFNLAGLGDQAIAQESAQQMPEFVKRVVELIDSPAYVLNAYWDAVAWNEQAASLFDIWLNESEQTKNLLRFMFTQPSAKQLIVNWPERAKRLVAEFRADCGWKIEQPELVSFVDAIQTASDEFRALWATQDVMEREGGDREFEHHSKGRCQFKQVTMRFSSDADYKLVMLMPEPLKS